MNLDEALSLACRNGYCLWLGAGVTMHLTSASPARTPSWAQLAEKLESDAGLKSPNFECSFPERLGVVNTKLGRVKFQKELRKAIIVPLADSIIHSARQFSVPFSVPPAAKQIGCLGSLANSIINFNIESITSTLLAMPSGPYSIKAFQSPGVGASAIIATSGSQIDGRYRRSVYHPHGCININGLCTLTESDYKAMNGTLAFQLASHAAFQEHLLIVGMSMEDAYLRDQITNFRSQICKIIWFVSEDPSPKILKWAWKNDIDLVTVPSWPGFWSAVEDMLPNPDRKESLHAWHAIIKKAYTLKEEVCSLHSMLLSHARSFGAGLSADWQLASENRGLETPCDPDLETKESEASIQLTIAYLKEINKDAP